MEKKDLLLEILKTNKQKQKGEQETETKKPKFILNKTTGILPPTTTYKEGYHMQ